MSLNAAMIQMMVDKGLSAQDIADIAKAGEVKVDRTAAERQARYRDRKRNGVTSRRYPPIDNTHTPGDISPDGENHQGRAKKRDVFPKPDWADPEVWADWLDVRKAKKARNTATAHKQFLADIEKLADDEWPPGRLLEHAVSKSWAGIYDPREKRNGTGIRTGRANRAGSSFQQAIEEARANLGGT